MTNQQYQNCIKACIECATECNHCAVSCLEEKEVQYLTKCIRLDLECAVICRTAADLMSLGSKFSKEICRICASVCDACAEICEQHANMGMEHCRECAEACRACARETMEAYQEMEKQDKENDKASRWPVYQDECAVISRAASELISLESTFAKEITQLNATICEASAKEFETSSNVENEHCKEYASIAIKAHQDLTNQDEKTNEPNLNKADKEKAPAINKDEANKKKKKHSSALLAASLWRSPVSQARSHVRYDVRGTSGLANTGPWIAYDEL